MADSQMQGATDTMNFGRIRQRKDCTATKTIVGEKFTNLRSIAKRFGTVNEFSYTDGKGIPTRNDFALFDTANFASEPDPNLESVTVLTADQKRVITMLSPVRYISYLYRFYAGSRRYKQTSAERSSGRFTPTILTTSPQWADANVEINQLDNINTWWPAIPTSAVFVLTTIKNAFQNWTFNYLNPMNEVTVPYLRQNKISLITSERPVEGNSRPFLFSCKVSVPGADGVPDPSYKILTMDAAGDDFSFGCLIGAPPLIDRYTNIGPDCITLTGN
jgi:hypothetical protein